MKKLLGSKETRSLMKKIKYSEITPEKIYKNRRSFVKSMGLGASSLAISSIPFLNIALNDLPSILLNLNNATESQ